MDESVIQGLRNTGFLLPWIDEGSRHLKILNNAYCYIILSIICYQFIFVTYTVMTIEDFEERCRLGVVLTIASNSTMLTIYYILHQKQLEKFSENANSLSQKILHNKLDKSDIFQELYREVAKNNNSFTVSVLFFVFCTPVIYCIPTPIIDLCNQSYRRNLPLPIVYPYDEHKPGAYELTFFMQMLALIYGDMKKFGNDCFFLAVFRIHSVYLKYLSISIKNLGQEFKKSGNGIMKRKLIKWMKLHEKLTRNGKELITLYTPVICIYYAHLICMVVFGIFTQIKHDKWSIESIGLGGFCLVNLFQLYMQCSTNDDIGTEAEKVAFELYNTPWYELNRSNNDMLRMMLVMAARPIDITAFKAPSLRLNKEAFLSFIASTITAVMTFTKMSEMGQAPA